MVDVEGSCEEEVAQDNPWVEGNPYRSQALRLEFLESHEGRPGLESEVVDD